MCMYAWDSLRLVVSQDEFFFKGYKWFSSVIHIQGVDSDCDTFGGDSRINNYVLTWMFSRSTIVWDFFQGCAFPSIVSYVICVFKVDMC